MLDDIIKNIYDKYLKNWVKNNYKYLLTILLYVMYQCDFIMNLINLTNINLSALPRIARISILIINYLIYVFAMIFIFWEDIKRCIKDLKKDFSSKVLLGLNCWIIGCLVMTISSVIISLITGNSTSTNEGLVRQSIKVAPIFMLFLCTVVAPIFEEMTFRKALYGLIKNKVVFIISSGVIFGLLHIAGSYSGPLDLLYVIPYGAMGCSFAFLLTQTDNIVLPIGIHMIHNFILVLSQILR